MSHRGRPLTTLSRRSRPRDTRVVVPNRPKSRRISGKTPRWGSFYSRRSGPPPPTLNLCRNGVFHTLRMRHDAQFPVYKKDAGARDPDQSQLKILSLRVYKVDHSTANLPSSPIKSQARSCTVVLHINQPKKCDQSRMAKVTFLRRFQNNLTLNILRNMEKPTLLSALVALISIHPT